MSSNEIWETLGWEWCATQNLLCRLGNIISTEEIKSRQLTHLDSGEIVTIIIRRLVGLNKIKPAISAVFGEPDFLPFRFLELGLRSGAAVCRLGRKFSPETANYFVKKLYEQLEKYPEANITASALTEMLSLNKDQKEWFFGNVEDNILKSLEPKVLANKIVELTFVPAATAFLVGRNHLLTNYHVFPEEVSSNSEGVPELDVRFLKEYIAQFSYEQDILGRTIKPVEYAVKDLLASDKELDYALVTLEEQPISRDSYSEYVGRAGDHFGWIRVIEDPMLIAPNLKKHRISDHKLEKELLRIQQEENDVLQKFLQSSNTFNLAERNAKTIDIKTVKDMFKERAKFGEPVNIIQHPKGRYKEIVVSSNWTLKLFDKYLWYEADADFSSSGSPVFNQQWQLVALHHAALPPSKDENGKQEGVRICKIVEHLRSKLDELLMKGSSRAEEIWRFLGEFAELDEYKPLPPLPSGQQEDPTKQKPPYYQG